MKVRHLGANTIVYNNYFLLDNSFKESVFVTQKGKKGLQFLFAKTKIKIYRRPKTRKGN